MSSSSHRAPFRPSFLPTQPQPVRIDKNVLAAFVDHTNAHNRALQKDDMWRARERELGIIRKAEAEAEASSSSNRDPSGSPRSTLSKDAGDDVMAEFHAVMSSGPVRIDWEAERRASEQARIEAKRKTSQTAVGEDRWGQVDLEKLPASASASSALPIVPTKDLADVWEKHATPAAPTSPKKKRKSSDRKSKKLRRRSRSSSTSSSSSGSSSSSSSDSDRGSRSRKKSKMRKHRSHSKERKKKSSRKRSRSHSSTSGSTSSSDGEDRKKSKKRKK